LAETNSEALNLIMVTDDFDADTFAENVDTKQHDTARSESDAGNVQHSVHTGAKGNEFFYNFNFFK
jgi:hypothetical protein